MDEIFIKIKTRDKKMFTKKISWGTIFMGRNYRPEKCLLENLPPGKLPPIPQRKKRKKRILTPEKITS